MLLCKRQQDNPMHIRELPWIEPVTAIQSLAGRPYLTFLDSAAQIASLGRYSYVACDPFTTFVIAEGQAFCNGEALRNSDPWDALRDLLAAYPQEHQVSLPPFQGGVAGYFGYDLNRTLERLPPAAMSGQGFPQALLNFYDTVLAYDHDENRCWVISTGWPEQNSSLRDERALYRANELVALLASPRVLRSAPQGMPSAWHSNFSREHYVSAVQRVIELILAGDIFQANISQRFSTKLPELFDPISFYCRLRSVNPAPFAALLLYGNLTIASSSPERFLKLDGRRVEARPIKGTIARSPDPEKDKCLGGRLLASEKDRAENVMIVDLLRNDLSRVCTAHSIEVPALCELEFMLRCITWFQL